MNFNNLKDLSREQLVELAGRTLPQGTRIHHKAKPETIIKQIMEHTLVAQQPQKPVDPYADPRLATTKEPVFHTEAQVEEAIAHIKAARPEFVTTYNHEDRTVKFSYKGVEETLNLSVPLRWMRTVADTIKYGRRAPMGLNHQGFDSMNSAQGKNAYTNAVLAG